MPFFDLTGQTAIVTGAATGIGEAITRRLARAGAMVAVADINVEGASAAARAIAGEPGAGAFPVAIDVSNPRSVGHAVAEVLARTSRIDVLVNNAGIAGRAAPLWEQTDEDWRQIIAVNMNGVFHCCRAVVPHMRERRYGRIVNIASIAGKEGNPNMTGYSATKAGVIAFTKALAKEVALEGICVNSVAPAVVRTRILDQLTPAQIEYMTERIPMRRTGTPEEIAAVVHFLSSPDCSFVTGQCYDASGGRQRFRNHDFWAAKTFDSAIVLASPPSASRFAFGLWA
jgi:2-dehydro-3-deoxy-L-rhamnonate dehydrogenase (NAD+)